MTGVWDNYKLQLSSLDSWLCQKTAAMTPDPSKKSPEILVGNFFSIFCSSKLQSKFCIEKTSKKVRKSRILASQNPAKTLPKSFQNRCPKKHAIFHRFWFEKCFVAKVPTSISYWFLQYFLPLRHFSSNRFLHAFSVQKTYQKPFQNDVWTLAKSMSKMCCFLTSFFSGFGLDFGASWASKMEPSWLLKP